MRAEDTPIAGTFLRGYLSAIRELTGPRYLQILKEAGLERFSQKYPPNTFEPYAKGENIMKLNQQLIQMLGMKMYTIVMDNTGYAFAKKVASSPLLQAQIAEIGPIKGQVAFLKLVRITIELAGQSQGVEIKLKEAEDGNGAIFTFDECVYCAGLTQIEAPCCQLTTKYFRQLTSQLSGAFTIVEEIDCGATHGQRVCHFSIKRIV